MPEGPNKNEERLRRYAKKRREESKEFSLHPATRRLLQGEVAREFGGRAKPERNRLSWLGLWRGRLALGAGLMALLTVAVWVLSSGPNVKQSQMKLAGAKA